MKLKRGLKKYIRGHCVCRMNEESSIESLSYLRRCLYFHGLTAIDDFIFPEGDKNTRDGSTNASMKIRAFINASSFHFLDITYSKR